MLVFMKDDGLHDRGGGGTRFSHGKDALLNNLSVQCIITVCTYTYVQSTDPACFSLLFPLIFSFLSTHIISFFCSWTNPGFSLQFIFPKRITLSTLNSVKYCEENTEYSIFVSSESLSLTHGDNNYSALRRKNLNNGSNPP